MENSKLKVKNLDGDEIEIDVIDIIENQDDNKQYICYTTDDSEDVYVSILEETDDSFTLSEITEEERILVEEYMNMNVEGE